MADLEQIARRPAQYLSQTGMPQLTGGLIMLIGGSSVLIQTLVMRIDRDYGLVAQWTGIFCVLIVLWRLSILKRRMVFPRGGYVKPRSRPPIYWLVMLVLILGMPYWVMTHGRSEFMIGLKSPLLWPAFAIVFAIISLDVGWREKSAPAKWFGVYLVCLAPLIWSLPVNNYVRGAALQVTVGAPLAILGSVRLSRFLKTNPMLTDTGDE